jgi:hypothetical protein
VATESPVRDRTFPSSELTADDVTNARAALCDSLDLVAQAASTLVELTGIAYFAASRVERIEREAQK